jgi:hypothetical protein
MSQKLETIYFFFHLVSCGLKIRRHKKMAAGKKDFSLRVEMTTDGLGAFAPCASILSFGYNSIR